MNEQKDWIMAEKRLFLLDAMALIYRAYFAMSRNPRINSRGQNTSAILGFTNTLLELLQKENPTHIAVAFDSAAPTVRHEAYAEYKATRESMPEDLAASLPWIRRIIDAFNIPVVELDGFEADDLIGTLAKKAEIEGYEVFMMTPDKDFGQLVSDRIRIYKPARMGSGAEVLGVKEVCDRFGIARPEQVIDILALWGDASDNIPGIPGIGEKIAGDLIRQYDSVEGLLENIGNLKGKMKENVEKYREQGLLSKRLATIIVDAPVEFDEEAVKRDEPDRTVLKELFEALEFRTIADRFFGSSEAVKRVEEVSSRDGVQGSLFDTETMEPAETRFRTITDTPHTYHHAEDAASRKNLISILKKADRFCFDTETTGLDTLTAELVGIAFAIEPGEAWFVRVPDDREGCMAILEEFRGLFEDDRKEKIGQNLKYDLQVLMNYGIGVSGPLFDTMIVHYLLQPELRHNMDYLAETYLNYSPVRLESLIGKKGKGQMGVRDIDRDQLKDYACEDADITFQLALHFEPLLKSEGSEALYREVEAPLIRVLASMERDGVNIDIPALKGISEELAYGIRETEEKVYRYAGFTFNISSPKQLGEVLFDRMKIVASPKKTKTRQYSTSEDVLSKLENHHPIIGEILEYRSLTKLKSTYVDTFPSLIHPITGRVHTSYNQAVTATGRLSSNNPNLQNIPIRTERGREIRKAFTAKDSGHLIAAADYSQIELRIIAHLSGDRNMQEAFRQGYDIHAATASGIYDADLDTVTSEMRRYAKMVNFGIIYGISAFGLAERLNIPRGEAAAIIEGYFRQYPGIKAYMEMVVEQARERGFVETMLGRRRYLRDINSGNAFMRQFAERNAINAPVQGTSADMIKIAMIRIQESIHQQGLQSRMIMQVHDELVFEVPVEELDIIKPIIIDQMKDALKLDVPVEVEFKSGTNWLEAH
jgi:DNA polymerase I